MTNRKHLMKLLRRLKERIGHRGAFLALLGLAYIFYGLRLYVEPAFTNENLLLSIHAWVYVWIVTGGFIFLRAFSKHDRYAFMLATFIGGWWSGRWFYIWIYHHVSVAWPESFLWFMITLAIFTISSWSEKTEVVIFDGTERDRE
jgi:hypothetical protein